MKIKKSAAIIIAFTVSLYFISCSGTQSRIIGKWQETESTETLEFFGDGTINLVSSKGAVVPGKYTFVESDHIKVEAETPEKQQITVEWKVKISGNEMILILLPNNRAITYRRVD